MFLPGRRVRRDRCLQGECRRAYSGSAAGGVAPRGVHLVHLRNRPCIGPAATLHRNRRARMKLPLPKSWRPQLDAELEKPYFGALRRFVDGERRAHTVYPPEDEVFAALELTPYERVKVMILG